MLSVVLILLLGKGAMLQIFDKLNYKPKTILELKGALQQIDDLPQTFCNIVLMHVLWPMVNILNIRCKLFQKIFY